MLPKMCSACHWRLAMSGYRRRDSYRRQNPGYPQKSIPERSTPLGTDRKETKITITPVPGSYRNNTKKGSATVTFKGLNDYGGTKTVKFKITAKPLDVLLKFWKD